MRPCQRSLFAFSPTNETPVERRMSNNRCRRSLRVGIEETASVVHLRDRFRSGRCRIRSVGLNDAFGLRFLVIRRGGDINWRLLILRGRQRLHQWFRDMRFRRAEGIGQSIQRVVIRATRIITRRQNR